MISPTQTRDIIEERIFVPLGTNSLMSSYLDSTSDMYGDDTNPLNYDSTTNLVLVPANYVNTDQQFFQFGDLEKGAQDFIVRPTTIINIKDKVIYGGVTYYVKATKNYVLGDTSIFTAIHCVEFL